LQLYLLLAALLTSSILLMSQEIRGHPQALVDAEKGTLDPLPRPLSHSKDVKPPPSDIPVPSKEKDALVTTTTQEVILSAKPTASSVPKSKRVVSRWILWNLWFNTYR
jgi:hypothetical protein